MVVVGIFDGEDAFEEALSRLGDAGIDESDVHRYDAGEAGTSATDGRVDGRAAPVGLAGRLGTTAPTPGTLAASTGSPLDRLGLEDEEEAYYQRLLSEGGLVLAVEVEENRSEAAARALEQAGASRVARHHR